MSPHAPLRVLARLAREAAGALISGGHRRFADTTLGHELDRRLDLRYLAGRLRREESALETYALERPPRPADQPSFSLIVPCYGIPRRYIDEMVASIEAQSYRRWEMCICDDGITEPDVRRRFEALARRDPVRYRVARHAENRGISAATRAALTLARGDVVVFVDADDVLHRHALAAVTRKLAESPEMDFVYTDHDFLTDWGHRYARIRKPVWSPELLFAGNYVNHLVAVRRQCLDRAGDVFADRVQGCQDWDLCFRLGRVARQVGHVPFAVYHWRARPGSMARDPWAKPWVRSATVELVREQVASTDVRLEPVLDPGGFFTPRLGRADALPPLLVVTTVPADAPPPAYRGATRWRRLAAAHDPLALARTLDATILAASADAPDDELLFLMTARRPMRGDLHRLAAFGCVRAVGCVWPFTEDGLRCSYTLDGAGLEPPNPLSLGRARTLVPIVAPRSAFSHLPGNVLTGPLHGLLVRRDVWRQVGGFEAAAREFAATDADGVGAAFGLSALRAGRRNVAARGVTTLPPTATVVVGAPSFDPYE